jgi:hypothetical protein
MHVICLHVQLQDFDRIFLLTKPVNLLLCVLAYLTLQYPISVLWTEHNVILEFADLRATGGVVLSARFRPTIPVDALLDGRK